MRYKIEAAPTFVQEAPTDPQKRGRSAFTLAAAWLTKKAEQGLEPVAVFAVGTSGCCHLYGDVRSKAAIVFRQRTPSTSPTTSTPTPTAKKRATK